ncbi:non-ribosomal peptide synthetase-like protein [Dinothrombium tinctorium]|uniref:Non-ribosomal peptide synthetase-like protein n=1 Tax=Dinothrombium tinctorium TaxID=1965070 RepID=A0A443R5R1_9ACAR|nr:non-ribosomal peptide synthetase-like protein [Dinothrombium tinctorium]RWS10887.1 non-ribosomal peptide synthetase-like protein [Dinothrombium tinctorium]
MDKLILKKTIVKLPNTNTQHSFRLSSDKLPLKENGYCSNEEIFSLDASLTKAIDLLSKEVETSNFMTLLTAFYLFLNRYTNKTKISIIIWHSESLINYQVQFLMDSVQDFTFKELLNLVKNGYCVRFQPLTSAKLSQDASNVSFALYSSTGHNAAPRYPAIDAKMNLDFNLFLNHNVEKTSGVLKYNGNIFDAKSIQRQLTNFQILLKSIVESENKNLPVGLLRIISGEEEKLIIENFSKTRFVAHSNKTIIELFEEQVAKNGLKPAIIEKKAETSYEQLNKEANKLAHFLRSNQSFGTCAILLSQGSNFVKSIIAVLKAGGSCAPLAVTNTSERLNLLLEDLNYPPLITTRTVLNKNGLNYPKIILLDEDKHSISSQPDSNLNLPRNPTDLAYVMFTSGSTGKPKGVLIEFKSLNNVVQWFKNCMSVSEEDRSSLIANPAFDAHIIEIWPHLITGSCLYVCSKKYRHNSNQILHWLQEKQITISFIPTAFAVPLIGEPQSDLSLTRLVVGGEKLNRFPHPQLTFDVYNCYGPTENSVISTFVNLSSHKTPSLKMPPIGKPIDNVQVYVLDNYLQPVPIGAAAELYVGGEGVARGYLKNEKLTKELYIESPFPHSQYLYRTGDLVAWTDDGNLVYKGRLKHELKHAQRDVSEIERILLQHPQVSQALAVVKGSQITCYCTLKHGYEAGTKKNLKTYLKHHVPQHLFPFALVILSYFPMTSNGKISKKSLPEI